ncbi:MAG: LysM peptidoglycan-binding domain-containing protein [Nocardioidaceae bacterium]
MLPLSSRLRRLNLTRKVLRRWTPSRPLPLTSPLGSSRNLRRARTWRTAPAATCAAILVVTPLAGDYTVKPGDTVWGIAKAHESTVKAIVRANRLQHGGDLIFPGDVLEIPAAHPRGPAKQKPRATTKPRAATKPVARTTDPDARRIVVHTVRRGDTVGAIAKHYHAWTRELIKSNGGSTVIHEGQRLRVPVVVARAEPQRARADSAMSRAGVRRIITKTARRHGVDPNLALAVSWQEAGWQSDVVSRADAVGAMQVIPSTGRWIGEMTGRELDLKNVAHNAYAGVVLLKFLQDRTSTPRALAGYYQGLAAVEKHGLYDDTKQYVRNVLAIKRRFEKGHYPH